MADTGGGSDQSHFVVPFHLAAHGAPNTEPPSYDQLGLAAVIRTAESCFNFRGHGRYLAHPDLRIAIEDDPWREVFGLAGSIGESLVIAAGCEVEVEWHRRAREQGDLPRSLIIAQRFFSIAEGQEILGVGHRLTNLVLRALAANPGIRQRLSRGGGRLENWTIAHTPFAEHRDAWPAFSTAVIETLTILVANSPHPAVRDLVATIADLRSSAAWRALDERRGQDFHRWRPESSVVTGLDRHSGFIRTVRSRDGVVGRAFGIDAVRYTMADQLEEEEAQVARSALDEIAAATHSVIRVLESALEPLSDGYFFFFNDGTVATRLGSGWDESNCSCCTSVSREPPTQPTR